MNKLNNYHLIDVDCCCVCINVIRPSYPFDWKCKFNNRYNAKIDAYGICDKFVKRIKLNE